MFKLRAMFAAVLVLLAAGPLFASGTLLEALGQEGRQTSVLGMDGINLCGAEFGENYLPGIYGTHYIYPDLPTVEYFLSRGMLTVRLPFRWERLQRTLGGDFHAQELARLEATVEMITTAGGLVILDVHNFARYHGQVIGSPDVPFSDFADLWGRLAAHFGNNDRVIFGLMNEPHNILVADWLEAANAAIAAIRNAGAGNLVLVPGANWGGSFSWFMDWGYGRNSDVMHGVDDPAGNFAIEVHLYMDEDNSGTTPNVVRETIGRERLVDFAEWCREHGFYAFLGEVGAPDSEEGVAVLRDTLDYLGEEAHDVFLGFTYWAAGQWWPEDWLFIVQPQDPLDPSEPEAPQLAAMRDYLATPHDVRFELGALGQRTGGGALRQFILHGEPAWAPEVQPISGWEFGGWDGSFGAIAGDRTFYAQYRMEGEQVFYVKHDAQGANNGSSWEDAFVLFQSGLDAARPGDEIWVAAGTYSPTCDYGMAAGGGVEQSRLKHFRLKNGVAVFGGFAGDESEREQRDWQANKTVLSGAIGDPEAPSDNAYHVFYHPGGLGLDDTAVLDGFTITGGNADSPGGAHRMGGGMHNSGSSPAVSNCTFSGNSAGLGGGASNASCAPLFDNCAFDGNQAVFGGGMFNHAAAPSMSNCSFAGNSAAQYGGGMRNVGGAAPDVSGSAFEGNSAGLRGGGMHNSAASPTVSGCEFSGNTAPGGSGGGMANDLGAAPSVSSTLFSGNGARLGGGMFNQNSQPSISGGTFSGNEAVFGGGMLNLGASPTVADSFFTGNAAELGGGMRNVGGSSPDVAGSEFGANVASLRGGGMYNTASSPTVSGCEFLGNTAGDGEGGGMANDLGAAPSVSSTVFSENNARLGGGMLNRNASPAVSGSTFTGNEAPFGGGMLNLGASPQVADCTFSGNSADLGAGMRNVAGSDPDVSGCLFEGNAASLRGGGMYNTASSPTVSGCEFLGNSTAGGEGGGMANDVGAAPSVSSTLFSENDARLGGGMLNRNAAPSVTGGVFEGNEAVFGGGMLNLGASPTVEGCTFSGNSADLGAGMRNVAGSAPDVSGCWFEGNAASVRGGGMHNTASSPTVDRCEFAGNSAEAGEGGGMLNDHASAPEVSNSLFAGNAARIGGAMRNDNSSPAVVHCTFAGNSAVFGGAVHNQAASPFFANTIIWGNEADVAGPETRSLSGSAPSWRHCNVRGSGGSAAWDPAFGTDLGGNLDAEPLYVDAAGGDYRLQEGSPCIDAGDVAESVGDFDLDGNPRIAGVAADMGAYEHPTGTPSQAEAFNKEVYEDDGKEPGVGSP